jgi:3'-phosphoadenosine 5'-phosphosulfate sulfotransferase (PAPS reductase)/FAD synthetase
MEATKEQRARLGTRRVIASVSGGKDSAALSLWLAENGIEHDRVFLDTGWEHEDTYAYLRGPLTKKLGPIAEVKAPLGMVELIRAKAMFPSRLVRFCTQELKVFVFRDYVTKRIEAGEDVVNAVGIRAEESPARAAFGEWEWSDTFDCDVWRPLIAWRFDDVVAIHSRHALAPNPLYLRGASRVGCWPCIYARKEEIRLVADTDPARIDLIRALEAEMTEGRKARGTEGIASYFALEKGRTRVAATIDEAVAWSRTASGGKNLAMFAPGPPDEGCMRWGLCETATPKAGE